MRASASLWFLWYSIIPYHNLFLFFPRSTSALPISMIIQPMLKTLIYRQPFSVHFLDFLDHRRTLSKSTTFTAIMNSLRGEPYFWFHYAYCWYYHHHHHRYLLVCSFPPCTSREFLSLLLNLHSYPYSNSSFRFLVVSRGQIKLITFFNILLSVLIIMFVSASIIA